MAIVLLLIALLTSIVGSVCGIGGGVIIKPALDAMNIMSVSAVSFLSGCTVLAMALISVGKSFFGKKTSIDKRITPALAVGAALGGVVGKMMFSYIKQAAGDENLVGVLQSGVLAVITVGTFVYMFLRHSERINTLRVKKLSAAACIGLVLGIFSSFLGIGGGPINLAVLSFFFSMDTKTAATNSLFIILLSQIASLIQTLTSGALPEFEPIYLVAMVLGGVIGGFAGQAVNRRLSSRQVETLFNILMATVVGISVYNALRFGLAM